MTQRAKTLRNDNGTITVVGDRQKRRQTGIRVIVKLDPASSNKVEAKLARLFAIVGEPSFFAREILLIGAQSAPDLINSKIEQLGGLEAELEAHPPQAAEVVQKAVDDRQKAAAVQRQSNSTALTFDIPSARAVPAVIFGSAPKSAADN